MVGFQNRYMVMEVFLDPNKDLSTDEPIILTQFNLSKAIKDSILTNFGECGLASSQNSFQGEIMQFNDLTLYILFPLLLVSSQHFTVAMGMMWYYACSISEMVCLCSVVKYVNPITKVCIFRTSRGDYQMVWAAITMVKSIGSCPVVFNLLDLSGELFNRLTF